MVLNIDEFRSKFTSTHIWWKFDKNFADNLMFVPEVMTCFKWQETEDNILMGVTAFRKKPRCIMRVEQAVQLRNNLLPRNQFENSIQDYHPLNCLSSKLQALKWYFWTRNFTNNKC